jgi:ankyrin repeat protein
MPKKLLKIILTVIIVIFGIRLIFANSFFIENGHSMGSSLAYMYVILALALTYIWTRPNGNDANLKKSNTEPEPQLITKVKEGDVDACRKLINENVNINQQDGKGATALIYAVLNQNEAVVTLLVSNGANINIATSKGLSPMAIAKNNNMANILEILSKNHTNQ